MYKRILIPTDGSDRSEVAAKHGVELAKSCGADVTALYVINEVIVASAVRQLGSEKKDVEERLQKTGERALASVKKLGDEAGVTVNTVIKTGAPANSIIDTASAEGASVIAMGSHGESGVTKMLIGSVVQKVLYWASCPVLVVR